jgi:hypothetical protein
MMSLSVLSSSAGVPNLWYAYHWWYAERFQVVRRKLEINFLTKKYASLPMGFTMVVRRMLFVNLVVRGSFFC